MKFTPLFAAEVQMMTPPRHQPRGSGRIRSSFRYSADDVRCKDCTRYDSGHLCHLNECIWLIAEHTSSFLLCSKSQAVMSRKVSSTGRG